MPNTDKLDLIAEVGGQNQQDSQYLYDAAILHQALQLNDMKLIDFILVASKNVDVNLVSKTHGSPLHVACKVGNIKVVQKLILSGAQILVQFNGKSPKEFTNNQKIVYLLEKYEKIQDFIQKKVEIKK
jgi:ankyrin repeat protein